MFFYKNHAPADVPADKKCHYNKLFQRATRGTGHFFLFAGDQKIEHLNNDFFDGGNNISLEDASPEHLFQIAEQSPISCLAVQPGLLARYGLKYRSLPYLVKMNSKTNLLKVEQTEPLSLALTDFAEVLALRERGLNIMGLGYTVLLGSEHEAQMLAEAGRLVYQAHQNGLLAVLWMYPRGKAITNQRDGHLIAGAAGVGHSLGADFVKVEYPVDHQADKAFTEVVKAAGNTGVIVTGGNQVSPAKFLEQLEIQLHAGAVGTACGRNLHQRPLQEAIGLAKAIGSMLFNHKTANQALAEFKNHLF